MAVAKTLAYYELEKIAALDSFIIQGTEAVFFVVCDPSMNKL
jgi:hypothetical protein